MCKSCKEKEEALIQQRRIEHGLLQRKRSFLWGALITIALALIALGVSYASKFSTGATVGLSVGCIAFFPFISCLFLENNFILDMFTSVASWGFVKMPGVIFSLDLDGIIWLLTIKLFFWILGIALAIVSFLLAVALCIVFSLFVYPFALAKNIKHPELSEF